MQCNAMQCNAMQCNAIIYLIFTRKLPLLYEKSITNNGKSSVFTLIASKHGKSLKNIQKQ
jgi:hypothetical protein